MSTVALFRGADRYQNVLQVLTAIERDVDWAGKQRILVKPNFTSTVISLAATHVDAVRAVLDFLKPRTAGRIVVGEGAGLRDTWEGFRNFGYLPLHDQYGVELVDLNRDDWTTTPVYDKHLQSLTLRVARTVVESDLRISIGPPKTHDTVVVTLALKNLVMSALIRDEKGAGGPDVQDSRARSVGSTLQSVARLVPRRVKALPLILWLKDCAVRQLIRSDKMLMHQSIPVINLNLFALARFIPPHLAILDGFQGMEGDGPNYGTPVDWRIAIASADWLAADTVAAYLMGVEIGEVGYLDYCRRGGLGVGDLDRIDVVGNISLTECCRVFQPSPTVEKQRAWRDPRIDAIIARIAGE
jgi:uncharacterized protein (DUF362 family)